MFRCSLFFAGAALWACAANAPAESLFPTDDFESGDLSTRSSGAFYGGKAAWNFSGVNYGLAAIRNTRQDNVADRTKFLGEFGGGNPDPLVVGPGRPFSSPPPASDLIRFDVNLSSVQNLAKVQLSFDLYLLRTWDGSDEEYGGPDTFGYGYNNNEILSAEFSDGRGEQTYCPGSAAGTQCLAATGSDAALKNKLGFVVELDPPPTQVDAPPKGTPMSLVYHITSPVLDYTADTISFYFFSRNLQVATYLLEGPGEQPMLSDLKYPGDQSPLHVADESWGLDNVRVLVDTTPVPEPKTWALTVVGLGLLICAAASRARA